MPLTRTACTHCGHWHLYFAGQDPPGCIVCSDVRNALPDDFTRITSARPYRPSSFQGNTGLIYY